MKKLLLVFALLIFPFQVTWAAVDGHCQQMQVADGEYCADRALQADADVDDGRNHDAPASPASDFDCSYCNASGVPILPQQSDILPPSTTAFQRAIEPELLRSATAERPERPQWPQRPSALA